MRIVAAVMSLLRDARLRYLVVALTNTLVGYSLYAVALFGLGEAAYLWALVFSHLFATTMAFFLYRKFVFHVRGSHLLDYARFQMVYLLSLSLNAVLLALIVSTTAVGPLLGQAICLTIVAIGSFFGHRHFSFRRSKVAD